MPLGRATRTPSTASAGRERYRAFWGSVSQSHYQVPTTHYWSGSYTPHEPNETPHRNPPGPRGHVLSARADFQPRIEPHLGRRHGQLEGPAARRLAHRLDRPTPRRLAKRARRAGLARLDVQELGDRREERTLRHLALVAPRSLAHRPDQPARPDARRHHVVAQPGHEGEAARRRHDHPPPLRRQHRLRAMAAA